MLAFIPYKPDLKLKARKNRNNPTKQEIRMWYEVLFNRKTGYKFTRQKPIDSFIIDFYSPELRMGIEIDGDTHAEQIEYDQSRTKILENLGIKIIRYTNLEVMQNIAGVCDNLIEEIAKREGEI